MIRPLVLVAAAVIALACTTTPPQPTDPGQPTGQPSAQPSGAPVPTGPLPTGAGDGVVDAASELLPPDAGLALPGLYLPAGTVGRGSDHYAFIQSPAACDELVAVLRAGEWTVTDQLSPPLPSSDPEAGVPEIPPIQWLTLRWADDMAVARVGGDASGCVAQFWRLAHVPYTASGVFESAGEATQMQLLCVAAEGEAQIGTIYVAPDGVVYSLGAQMPLEVGSHPLDENTEVSIGRSELDIADLSRGLFSGGLVDGLDDDALSAFFPADLESGQWQGSINVTSIEPLTGEIVLEDLRDEAGRSQSLRSGFRCDLPPGQLTRAAEAEAGPSPSPAPASKLTIDISAGPHAGTHEIESPEVSCSFDLLSNEAWLISYSAPGDPVQGELQTLLITVPAGGARSSVTMFFGDDFEDDWFDTDRATGEVTDGGDTADLAVTGTASGVDFEVTIACAAVDRP